MLLTYYHLLPSADKTHVTNYPLKYKIHHINDMISPPHERNTEILISNLKSACPPPYKSRMYARLGTHRTLKSMSQQSVEPRCSKTALLPYYYTTLSIATCFYSVMSIIQLM